MDSLSNYFRKITFSFLLCFAVDAYAKEIRVGMTTALSGPAKALGSGVKAGVEAHFHEINATGGVNGHKIKLIAKDDGYEPAKAAPNMRELIEKEKVVAVIGNVGTPTAIVTVPIANELKRPLIGAFTGAGVLRKNPPDRYVINYRASYAEETAAMVEGVLSSGVKPEEIAFFTQNDGYGDAGFKGAVKALVKNGFTNSENLAHGRYTRNTKNIEEGLGVILDADVEPKAIIMVGAYGACAEFILTAKEELPEAAFINVSFVGSEALKNALGDQAEGVIVTQVVPHFSSDLPAVNTYRKALSQYDKALKPSFVSLEGYLAARVFVEGIKKSKDATSAESIIDGLESLGDFDLGIGQPTRLSQTEHQVSHKVWPTIIKNGRYENLVDWKDALNR